jgi:hypothetical protein
LIRKRFEQEKESEVFFIPSISIAAATHIDLGEVAVGRLKKSQKLPVKITGGKGNPELG